MNLFYSRASKIVGVCFLLLSSNLLYSQDFPEEEGAYDSRTGDKINVDDLPQINRLFESSSTLKIHIETNLSKLYQFKDDAEYQKALFKISVNDTISVFKKIKIKVRGNTRVTICDTPPLKIDFKKTKFKWQWFDGLNSLKVISPCSDGKNYSRYILKEYFAYKAFNIFTDMSYEVRLVELTLSDNQNGVDTETVYAVFVESDKNLAKRTGSNELENDDTSSSILVQNFYLNPSEKHFYNINLFSLYQLMIGNTDWGASSFHNTKIFLKAGTMYPVPYDFDYAGLINTSYAIPSRSLPIKSVTERYYMGPCCESIQFEKALNTIHEKKSEIYSALNTDPYISQKAKKEMLYYINDFYKLIEDPAEVEKLRNANCQN